MILKSDWQAIAEAAKERKRKEAAAK